MAFKEAPLPLVADLGPATVVAIEKCVAMAVDIGARISAVAVELDAAVMIPVDRDEAATIEKTRGASNAGDLS
jgi:hypothetical protein